MNPLVAWGVWIVAVLGCAGWAEYHRDRPDHAGLVAQQDMPPNTLLLPGQFVPSRLAMGYVARPGGMAAGDTLTEADVAPQPTLIPVAEGTVLTSVQVDWMAVVGGLNAGSKRALCRDTTTLVPEATVRAVRCGGPREARSCIAAIAVPATAGGALEVLGNLDMALHLASRC